MAVVNTANLLTRLIPLVLEDPNWEGFWWTPTPVGVVVSMVSDVRATQLNLLQPAGSTEPHTYDGQPSEAATASVDTPLPLAETLLDSILVVL